MIISDEWISEPKWISVYHIHVEIVANDEHCSLPT